MGVIMPRVSSIVSFLLMGMILLGSSSFSPLSSISSFASAQECPVLFSPTDVNPSQAYDYTSPDFKTLFTSINRMTDRYVTQHRIASHAVAIVHKNRLILTKGLSSTPFRIASITKTFTALGAFILREQGRLSIDDPVKKFLPSFSIINPYEGKGHDTTLRELMGHAAGFPQQQCPFLTICTDDETEILKQISRMQLISPPWSQFPAYSNLGIALLGRAWEKATVPRVSWEEFVVENILKPLGMSKSGVNVSDAVQLAPNGHPWALQDLGWNAPAAQMYSTAEDLAKYMSFLLTAEPPLISPNSIREWMSPATIFPDGKGGYSFPWELQKLHEDSKGFLITKGGSINGYNSHIDLDPSTQVGVVVLTVFEPGSSGSPDELAGNILKTLIPAVESINQKMIEDIYAGVYKCPASKAFASPNWDFDIRVREGIINVSVSPTVGLLADVRIDVFNGDVPVTTAGTWALLLKNETENSFWFGDGTSCNGIVGAVGAGPDLENPNAAGSSYANVVVFDTVEGSVQWPAVGAHCYRAETQPSKPKPRISYFYRSVFSFFVFFFAF
ncbi:unnamed protein product [Calypogeia fissa]